MKIFPDISKPKDTLYTLLAGVAFLSLAIYVQVTAFFQSRADPSMLGHHFIGHGMIWFLAIVCAHPAVLGGLTEFFATSVEQKEQFSRLTAVNKCLLWLCGLTLLVEDIPVIWKIIRMTRG